MADYGKQDVWLLNAINNATLHMSTLRLSQLAFLLVVKGYPGRTQVELARLLDTSTSTVSRQVDVFGTPTPTNPRGKRKPLLGFIREVRGGFMDHRVQRLFLSEKGISFINTFHLHNHGQT